MAVKFKSRSRRSRSRSKKRSGRARAVKFRGRSSRGRRKSRASSERKRRIGQQQIKARQAELTSIRKSEESARLMRTAKATQSLLRPDPYYSQQGSAFAQGGVTRNTLPSFTPRNAQDLVRFEQQMNLQRYSNINQAVSGYGGGAITSHYNYDPRTGGTRPERIPGYYEDYYMRSKKGRDARRNWTWTARMQGLADYWSQYQQVTLPPPIDEGYTDLDEGYDGGGYGGWPSYGGYSGDDYKPDPRWMREMTIWNIT